MNATNGHGSDRPVGIGLARSPHPSTSAATTALASPLPQAPCIAPDDADVDSVHSRSS
jgi:hypothetical protein